MCVNREVCVRLEVCVWIEKCVCVCVCEMQSHWAHHHSSKELLSQPATELLVTSESECVCVCACVCVCVCVCFSDLLPFQLNNG